MFATETEKLVNDLIQAEYQNACENWGEKYHSKKEACDVLDEEVKEVVYELDGLQYLNLEYIKCAYYDNFQLPDDWIEETEKYVKNAIKELAQVGAVVRKIRTTKDEVEE